MKKHNWTWMAIVVLVSLLAGACTLGIERNPDGSLRVEVNLTEESIQDEIEAALNDPLISNVQVDLREGYIVVTGDRKRIFGDEFDQLSFRLDLGTQDGHLTSVVSQAMVNDQPFDPAVVAVWNERIANHLERAAKRNPDATLQSVTVGGETLTFVWRVETARSRG